MRKEQTLHESYFFEEEEFKDKLGIGCDRVSNVTVIPPREIGKGYEIQVDVTKVMNDG